MSTHKGPIESPAFIGIGASFAGWSDLKKILSAHPSVNDIVPSLDYFSTRAFEEKDSDWYNRAIKNGSKYKSGEFSPSYFSHPKSAERIASTFPDSKLLAIIRHPLERAVAEYNHYKKIPNATRYASCSEFMSANPAVLARGMYGENLSRYFSYYSPLDIHIINRDDLVVNPLGTIQKVYRFLDIYQDFVPPTLKTYAPPEDEPKHPSLIRRAIMFSKKTYRHYHPVQNLWQPETIKLENYFTPEEIKYWYEYHQADLYKLSDIVFENMIEKWKGEDSL